MKIYTKTGDNGDTSLYGGRRIDKDAIRVHAYGTCDELNAILGVILALDRGDEVDKILNMLQNQLFVLGGDLATPDQDRDVPRISLQHVDQIEAYIDDFDSRLSELTDFILPRGVEASAQMHHARSVCRRMERWVVTLNKQNSVGDAVLAYINRLSDLLFVLARFENAEHDLEDTIWEKEQVL